MREYKDLLHHVLTDGQDREDRTGVGTRSVFGAQIRVSDISSGFPLLTTKRVHFKSIVHELIWFLSGDTNVKYLQDNGVKIWDAWSTKEECAKFGREEGDLGPIYSKLWTSFGSYEPGNPGVNQIERVIESIRTNPHSRRHIVSAWDPDVADKVTLPPCHTLFQFYVREDKYLDCHLYQRSGDIFLGVPFNIASYALLTSMIAALTGLEAGDLICSYGDLHLYSNHFDQAREQLSRRPRTLPTLLLNTEGVERITDFTYDHIKIENYNPHPAIKAPVAV